MALLLLLRRLGLEILVLLLGLGLVLQLQHAEAHSNLVSERASALERTLESQASDARFFITDQLRQH